MTVQPSKSVNVRLQNRINFQPLEVVDRLGETHPRVGENLYKLT